MTMLARRRLLQQAALAGLAGTVSIGRASAAGDEMELKVQVDFLVTNSQVGDVVAVQKSFYKDVGLKVELLPGGPNNPTGPVVLSGHALLGIFSGLGQALVARGNGLPVKVYACGYQTSPFSFISLPASPIRTPADMVGKRIAVQPSGRFNLEAILKKNGIDPASVTIINAGTDMTALIAGQADAVSMFITNGNALAALGGQYHAMTLTDAKIPAYANAYFTAEDRMAQHGDAIARYIAATAKAWGWAYANREEAATILTTAFPNLSLPLEKATIDAVMTTAFTPATARDGWGTMDPAAVQEIIDLYAGAKAFTGPTPKVDEIVTFDVLKQTAADRPKLG